MKKPKHQPTHEFIKMLNDFKTDFLKENFPTDGSKPFVKVKDNLGSKFKMTLADFVYFMNECLAELGTPGNNVEYYEEQRQILFETYFTFAFFAREFGWDCKEMGDYKEIIDSYLRGYSSEIQNNQ